MNLLILSANLENTSIQMEQPRQSEHTIYIFNSTFDHLQVLNGFEITVTECTIDGTTKLEIPWMETITSSINLNYITFYNLYSASDVAIRKAVASKVYMEGIYCGNSYGGLGLIQILNGSVLNLNKSTFEYNGNLIWTLSAVTVKFNSMATIDSSSFIGNHAYNYIAAVIRHFSLIILLLISILPGKVAQ